MQADRSQRRTRNDSLESRSAAPQRFARNSSTTAGLNARQGIHMPNKTRLLATAPQGQQLRLLQDTCTCPPVGETGFTHFNDRIAKSMACYAKPNLLIVDDRRPGAPCRGPTPGQPKLLDDSSTLVTCGISVEEGGVPPARNGLHWLTWACLLQPVRGAWSYYSSSRRPMYQPTMQDQNRHMMPRNGNKL